MNPHRTCLCVVLALAAVCPVVRAQEEAPDGKTVSEWIETLRDDDPLRRQAAIEALGKTGPAAKAAVPALIGVLKDDDPYSLVRWEATEALGRIGPEAKEAIPPLVDALKDPCVGLSAADALAAIGTAAIPALTEALRDQNYQTRHYARSTLKKMGPEGIAVLNRQRVNWALPLVSALLVVLCVGLVASKRTSALASALARVAALGLCILPIHLWFGEPSQQSAPWLLFCLFVLVCGVTGMVFHLKSEGSSAQFRRTVLKEWAAMTPGYRRSLRIVGLAMCALAVWLWFRTPLVFPVMVLLSALAAFVASLEPKDKWVKAAEEAALDEVVESTTGKAEPIGDGDSPAE